MKKNIYIIGGGTFSPIRVHESLAVPSFGKTARQLDTIFKRQLQESNLDNNYEVKLVLTKMADPLNSKLVYNTDVSKFLDTIIADPATKGIIFNTAMQDFNGQIGDIPSGPKAKRLASREGPYTIELTPAEKVINKIRKNRKDIFAVGFKTADNDPTEVQYQKGLKLLKDNSLNLVLVNDVIKYENMIVVPEENSYKFSSREDSLEFLVKMMISRMQNTFTRSTVVDGPSVDWNGDSVPDNLRQVVNHCIDKGAYKPFQGKTVGHFAVKVGDGVILTSKRKTNFNELDKIGLVKIESQNELEVIAYGAKPSVGGQSQRSIFQDHPELDCIAHFHCPIKENTTHTIPVKPQWPNECGSHECGKNTSAGLSVIDLGDGEYLKVVYLDEHGPNIVFSRNVNPQKVITFIDNNFDLSKKTGGVFTSEYM
jgi:hypothetical protein